MTQAAAVRAAAMMLALLPTGEGDPLVRLGEAPEPRPAPDETVVAVEAVSLNRGEVFLLERPRCGWRPRKASRAASCSGRAEGADRRPAGAASAIPPTGAGGRAVRGRPLRWPPVPRPSERVPRPALPLPR